VLTPDNIPHKRASAAGAAGASQGRARDHERAGIAFDIDPGMKPRWCVVLMLLAGGCAVRAPHGQAGGPDGPIDRPAAALVFDPPVASGEVALDLWRDRREPSAFVAWDDLSTTWFYLRIDDRFTDNRDMDRYVRRAVIEKVGVSYR